jgi:hypothetical protein
MPETEQININPAAFPDFHTSSGDNVLFCPLPSVRVRSRGFSQMGGCYLLKYNGGDSEIKISVLYWRCSLIRVSAIWGSTYIYIHPRIHTFFKNLGDTSKFKASEVEEGVTWRKFRSKEPHVLGTKAAEITLCAGLVRPCVRILVHIQKLLRCITTIITHRNYHILVTLQRVLIRLGFCCQGKKCCRHIPFSSKDELYF